MFWTIAGLLLATVAGLFVPRLPAVLIPRLSAMEGGLADFPKPQPVNKRLIAQLLQMRTLWSASFVFSLIPISTGLLILTTYADPIAFGLLLGGGWSILSRLIPGDDGSIPNTPYGLDMIDELDQMRRAELNCCSTAEPCWEVAAVRCSNCKHVHMARARPDLGRRRGDKLVGVARILLQDSHPMVRSEE